MRRPLLAVLVLIALLVAGSGHAATRTYSTGTIHAPIPDGGTVERSIAVSDTGPVSHVDVAVRIAHPRDSDLTLTLVSPRGTEVPLSVRRGGDGASYGSGAHGCHGQLAVFEDGWGSLAAAKAPLVGAFSPERPLSRLSGEEARGRWTLRVADDAPGAAGTLFCWQLDLSRNVVEHVSARSGAVSADLSYRESNFAYRDVHVTVRRAGRIALSAPLSRFACKSCPSSGFNAVAGDPLTIRDLDGDGEPEVLVDVYTGGAHCCLYTAILRHLDGTYRGSVAFWGNPGYSLERLDERPGVELVSSDDSFAYAFTSYAASAEPVQIWRYERGKLSDITSGFPSIVRRDADDLWREYLDVRQQHQDVRGVLAAWLADEYRLGLADEGWKKVEAAQARGELSAPRVDPLWPAGRKYLDTLRRFLVKRGYTRVVPGKS